MKFDPARWQHQKKPEGVATLERSIEINRSPEEVFDFTTQGENFPKIFPLKVEPDSELDEFEIKLDHVYPFKVWYGILPIKWVAHIVELVRPECFVDELVEGPLKFWRHTHLYKPVGEGRTLYTDKVEYSAPLGWIVEKFMVSGQLEKLFEYRQKKMKELLEGQ